MKLVWSEISNHLGPRHHLTDFGSCCTLIPQLHLKPINYNLSVKELYHGLKTEALNGEANGLNFVLNTEQFNYMYYDYLQASYGCDSIINK